MLPHGEFEIHVRPPVIFSVPKTAFNPEGVKACYDAVLEKAKPFDEWILFEQPTAEAAVTSDSIEAITDNYQRLRDNGCVGIALLLSNVVARFLAAPQRIENIGIPFKASKNHIELSHFVEELVEDINQRDVTGRQTG